MPQIIRRDEKGIFEVLVTRYSNESGVQIDTVGGSVELSRDAAQWLLDVALPAMLHGTDPQLAAADADPRGRGDGLGR